MANGNNQKIFYGWWIVLASSIIIFFSAGIIFYSFGVFLKPLEAEFGWSRVTISMAVAAWALVFGFSGPVIGVLFHKYGAKIVITCCAAATGLCYLILAANSSLFVLFAMMSVLGFSSAGITLIPNQALISNWFEKYRGRAMGIMMMGIGFGGLIMPQIANKIIITSGWRTSFRTLGLIILFVTVPTALLFIRTRPSDMGLRPDGLSPNGGGEPGSEEEHTSVATGLSVKRALRTSSFWLLFVAFALLVFGESGLTVHFVAFVDDAGMSSTVATFFWSLAVGLSSPSRLAFGFLADRWDPKKLIAITHGVHAVATAILVVVFLGMGNHSSLTLGLFSITYGLSLGGSAVLLPVLVGRCFGLSNFSKVLGTLMSGFAIGVLGGPLLAGAVFQSTGSYRIALIIFTICFGLASLAVALIKTDKYKDEFAAE